MPFVEQNQFVIYENAAHGLFVTHAERLNADLLRFAQGANVSSRGMWDLV